jgi:hypothetical protein
MPYASDTVWTAGLFEIFLFTFHNSMFTTNLYIKNVDYGGMAGDQSDITGLCFFSCFSIEWAGWGRTLFF